MKTCEQVAELLPALAEDILASAEAEEVRAHIAGCAACAESWRLQELISRHFRETDLADKPDYYWAKQRKHILDQVGLGTARFEKADSPRRPVIRVGLAAAAAVLLAVGAFTLFRKSDTIPANGTIVREPKRDLPRETPIVKEEPKPETPEAPPKKDEVVEAQAQPDAAPPENPVVENDKKKIEPKKVDSKPDIAKDKPGTTSKSPPKEGPVAPKIEEVALLPGHARYAVRLAEEQAEVLMPLDDMKSPVVKDRVTSEQAQAILKSARARIEDIRLMTARDPKADITEQVDAYCILVSEGAMPILIRINSTGQPLGAPRQELRTQKAELDKFTDEVKKGSLLAAIQTCGAANNMLIRRHTPRSRDESGALGAARDISLFVASPGTGTATIPLRTRWGLMVSNRFQIDMLEHVRAGRVAESEAGFEAYTKVIDAVVLMLDWIDVKDAVRVCSETRRDLHSYIVRFGSSPAQDATRHILANARRWTAEMIDKINQIEEKRTGKLPRTPDKKDPPKEPPKDPPPPPPPPAPPFGEKPPDPPPAPPPPPFGEQPK